MTQKFILLVSGLSGAGKSEALRSLEDMGYEAIDNLPLRLVPALLSDTEALPARMALGMDIRNHDISTHYEEAVKHMRESDGIESHLLYLTADDDELLRRFSKTRRRHPLAVGRPLVESIQLEKQVLAKLQDMADTVLDTTRFSPTDMARTLNSRFSADTQSGMQVFVMSFGFKHGLPREVDIVLDVRFLKNPYWDKELQPKNGLDADIVNYVTSDTEFNEAFQNMQTMLHHQLKQFEKAGRAYVTVAIGCTGGHHRSVVVAQQLGAGLKAAGFQSRVHHRDLNGVVI